MLKNLLLSTALFINCSSNIHHEIEIAIANGDLPKLNLLLRKTMSSLEKKKYVDLAREVTLKHSVPMSVNDNKRNLDFIMSAICLSMSLEQLYQCGREIGSLDDIRRYDVVMYLSRGCILGIFGLEKFYETYRYNHKNKKYNIALQIEEVVASIPTDIDMKTKKVE